ncbi:MAG: tetratricopeptide repeat protein [Pirellulales bacterium]|nr:tetratricopeptide repeat protein [Pirellulales bacterium]
MSEPANAQRSDGKRERLRHRVVNVRVLVVTLVAVAVLAPSAWAWHRRQIRRIAVVYGEQAREFEAKGDHREAARQWERYLRVHPDDVEAKVSMARAFATATLDAHDANGVNEAIILLYEVAGVAPDEEQAAIRGQLAEVLLAVGRLTEAQQQADRVLKLDPNDKDAKRLRALALFGQIESGTLSVETVEGKTVVGAMEDALRLQPGNIQLARLLAEIHRNRPGLLDETQKALTPEKRCEKADAIMDGMVRSDPKNSKALLARYAYRRQHKLPRAEDDLAKALECDPDDAEARLLAGGAALAEGNRLAQGETGSPPDPDAAKAKFKEAQGHYQHVLDASERSDPRACVGLGHSLLSQGDADGALAAWRKGLAAIPEGGAAQQTQLRYDLNHVLAENLLRLGRFDEAEKAIAVLEKSVTGLVRFYSKEQQSTVRIGLAQENTRLRAWLLMGTNRLAEAASLLEGLTTCRWSSPAEEAVIWRWLGACRAGLRRPREAAEAFEEALARDPASSGLRLAAANARRDAGDGPAALAHFERLLEAAPKDSAFDGPDVWLSTAALQFQQQVSRPQGQRDWRPFLAALQRARQPRPDRPLVTPWRLPLLEADYAYVRAIEEGRREQGVDAAVAILRKAEESYGEDPDLCRRLVGVYEQLGRKADADRALGQFEKVSKDALGVCQLRATLQLSRGEVDAARQTLKKGAASLPEQARPQLEYALVDLDLRQGNITEKEAYAKLESLTRRAPDNMMLMARRANLAIQLEDLAAMAECERELERLEGAEGALWRYCRGQRLLAEAAAGKPDRLPEVEPLVADLRKRRADWDRTHVLAGMLHEAQGRFPEAIAEYDQAIRRGSRTVAVFDRLVRLLYSTEQYDKAEEYLAQLRGLVPQSRGLSGVAIEMAWKQGELTKALEAAQRGVKERPDDALSRIWLGQMVLANGRADEAEAEFKKAVDLAPGNAAAREVLWRFYLSEGQVEKARQALSDLADRVTLTDAKRALVLAVGHEVLSSLRANDQAETDRQKALEFFTEAARLAPDDPDATLGLLRLQANDDVDAAQKMLEDFLRRVPDNRRVQRTLAVLLATRGGEAEWKRAEALMAEMGEDDQAGAADQRLLARMLVGRGGKANLERAQQIIQKLIGDARAPLDADRTLLAKLYDLQGNASRARQQLAMVVDRDKPDPSYLATYADLLLRQGELDEAARQIDRLEKLVPDQFAALALRARLLDLQGRAERIEPLVEEAAKRLLAKVSEEKEASLRAQREAALAARIGRLYQDARQFKAAEKWYRRLTEANPNGYALLAANLAAQGRMPEAIDLCLKAAESDASVGPASALASALTSGAPSAEDLDRAEPLLAKAQAAHPDNAALLMTLGTVRILQGRIADAVDLYRRVLAQYPNNTVAMNNLATILSEIPERRAEAAEQIDRAIAIAGPQPMLVDTKAWIALLDGKADVAASLLEEVTAPAGSDARFDVHLALAYDRLGKAAQAKEALGRAKRGRVELQVLTATERKLLDELVAKHGS